MRTIKFRGFNRKNGVWLCGFYLQNRGAHFVCPDEFANGKSWDDYEVDEDSIGQFTGLLDKNGKEIYEGDIISRRIIGTEKSTWEGVVRQKGAAFVCVNKHDNKYYLDMLFESVLPLDVVVIGYIYDNPELLK